MIESKSIALPTWRYPNIEMTFLVILNLKQKYKGFLNPCASKMSTAEKLISYRHYDDSISSGDSECVCLLFQLGENVFGRNDLVFIDVQDQVSGS
jgi:hypothetical protein